jgi:hypothetical protein
MKSLANFSKHPKSGEEIFKDAKFQYKIIEFQQELPNRYASAKVQY